MDIEQSYKSFVNIEHRKQFGQFYTHANISDFMIKWVLEKNPKSLYDPAFGMGAFFFASERFGFKGKFIGSEIDEKSYNFFKRKISSNRLNLINEDYFSSWGKKYDSIICNPPYFKFQNFLNKDFVLSHLAALVGEKISGYINVASAFLLKSIFELNEGGRLAYIMPFEFLNTGYGVLIKKVLLSNGKIHNIIQVLDESDVFSEVTTTVCIIQFEKTKETSNCISFSMAHNITNINNPVINSYKIDDINPKVKWLSYFRNRKSLPEISDDFVPLSEYGNFKRGIATGANEFFTLNKSKIKKIGLNDNEYRYCITKSNQIKSSFFTDDDLFNLENNDVPVFIFSPSIPTIQEHGKWIQPNLFFDNEKCGLSVCAQKYIQEGERNGYDKRYLTRGRKVWYSLEKRNPAPILFSVFSRGEYKIIRNKTSALYLTCYHGFVPSSDSIQYIDKLFIFLKSKIGKKMIAMNERKYGNNLNKFEPNDLNDIKVPQKRKLDLLSDFSVKREMNNLLVMGRISDFGNQEIENIFH